MIAETIKRLETTDKIAELILGMANLDAKASIQEFRFSPLHVRLNDLIEQSQPLKFILPAFPAKSPNRGKTSGARPDLGEVIGLQRLNQLCHHISSLYEPGCEVLICSDGRVFNDIVLVSDEDLQTYQEGIATILRDFELNHLKTFSLDDVWPNLSGDDRRAKLIHDYAPSLSELRESLMRTQSGESMFNGIHRFMKEDRLALFPEHSRSRVDRDSKLAAYEVIQRSRAWDRLLEEKFPGTLRLSIHPYPMSHHKFGIRLVPARQRWTTPWHAVTVKLDGEYTLMKRSEALRLGASEKWFRGEYAYFEL